MPTDEQVQESQAAYAAWRAKGSPYPLPGLPEYLTFDDLLARESYVAQDGTRVPVLPGQVQLVGWRCPTCGQERPGFVEYADETRCLLACSKDCAATAWPEHPRLAPIAEEAAGRVAQRAEYQALVDQLAALAASLRDKGVTV